MIRKMLDNDIPSVSSLVYNMYSFMDDDLDFQDMLGTNEEFSQKFSHIANLEKHHHFVYEHQQKIIAYYLLTENYFPTKYIFDNEWMCYLSLIVVGEKFQNQGFGKKMLEHAKQQALNLGYQELNIEVSSSSKKNRDFYQKQHFQELTQHLICFLEEKE